MAGLNFGEQSTLTYLRQVYVLRCLADAMLEFRNLVLSISLGFWRAMVEFEVSGCQSSFDSMAALRNCLYFATLVSISREHNDPPPHRRSMAGPPRHS